MPGYHRAELSVELTAAAEHAEAVAHAAAATGLARESGPGATLLSGGRAEVLDGLRRVLEASLDAGAQAVELRVEVQGEAERFDSP